MGRIGNWLAPVLTARSQLLSPISSEGLSLLLPEHAVPNVDRLPESLAAYMKPAIFCRAFNREALIGDNVTLDLSGDHNDLFNVTIPGWMNPDTAQISIYELKTLSKLPAHLSFTCDAVGIFDLYFGIVTNDTVKKLLGLSFNVCHASIACLDTITPTTPSLGDPATMTSMSTDVLAEVPNTTQPAASTTSMTSSQFSTTTSTSTSTSAQSLASFDALTQNGAAYTNFERSSTNRDVFDMAASQRQSQSTSTLRPTSRPFTTSATTLLTTVTGTPITSTTIRSTTATTAATTASTVTAAVAAAALAEAPASAPTSAQARSAHGGNLRKPPGVPQEAWDWFLSTRNGRGRSETTAAPHTIIIREVIVPSPSPLVNIAQVSTTTTTTTSTTIPTTLSATPSHPLAGKVMARLRRDRLNDGHGGSHRNRTHSLEGDEEQISIDEEEPLFDEISLRAPPGAYNVYLEPAPINPEIVQRLTREV